MRKSLPASFAPAVRALPICDGAYGTGSGDIAMSPVPLGGLPGARGALMTNDMIVTSFGS